MDTDDLSEGAYKATIVEAERFNHNLALQFGLLSYSCKSEVEYLEQSLKLIEEIKCLNEFGLDDMFFGKPPKKERLYKALDKIRENIHKLKDSK